MQTDYVKAGLTETVSFGRAEGMSFDERWAAWVARGVEHDRKMKTRAIALAAVVMAVVALALVIFLLR